jgi:putative ABC transport system ATP-binding protein
MQNKTNIVILQNVVKGYQLGETHVPALRGVSLEINAGDFLTIAGPSGSGKSTLLNLIGGIDLPDEGTIEIAQNNLADLNDDQLSEMRAKHIGFIFQSFNLIPVLNALENVEYPLLLTNTPDSKKLAREALKHVGLENFVKHRPNELSGGQRQRVAIARALVGKPFIILADEPTANLDSKTSEEIIDLMLEINAEDGVTFIFSTHDPLVMKHARRMATLKDGQIEEITKIEKNK